MNSIAKKFLVVLVFKVSFEVSQTDFKMLYRRGKASVVTKFREAREP